MPDGLRTKTRSEAGVPSRDARLCCYGEETRATQVSGTIFLFTSVNTGQVFTVTDADGRVLLRDRGRIRETILFDTLGDNVPGGAFIESVDFSVAGPHPGLFFDTCSLLG